MRANNNGENDRNNKGESDRSVEITRQGVSYQIVGNVQFLLIVYGQFELSRSLATYVNFVTLVTLWCSRMVQATEILI